MNGRRKPRKERERANPLIVAMNYAGKLTRVELAAALAPARTGHKALREGVATEEDWLLVVSAMNIADSIELQRIVCRVRGHIQAAQHALQAVAIRATASDKWQPTALTFAELEDVAAGMDVFAFQLAQLSYGEYRRALDRAVAEVRSTGGTVHNLNSAGAQLACAGA